MNDVKAVSFSVFGTPAGKGRPRFNRKTGRTYTPEKTAKGEWNIRAQAIPHKPKTPVPFGEQVGLHIKAFFSPPASWSAKKRERALNGLLAHTTRPDLDNVVKMVKDALNGVFWMDDQQVTDLVAWKRYSVTPRLEIRVMFREEDGHE